MPAKVYPQAVVGNLELPMTVRTLKKGSRLSRSSVFFSLAYRLVMVYCSTLRTCVEGEENWLRPYKNGKRVILCAWHQQFFPTLGYFRRWRHFRPAIMVSRSADGDLVSKVVAKAGWRPVRGSSSKGGFQALREMIVCLKRVRLAGHILDGPQGPAGRIKPGIVLLALAADAAVIPVYLVAERAWQFNSWDRFLLPKPFSRITIRFDRPFYFHRGSAHEAQRKTLEKRMRPALQ